MKKGIIQVNTWVKAIEDYEPPDEKGLAFRIGDIFLVSQMDSKMSGFGALGGRKGWFPMEHVVETEKPATAAPSVTLVPSQAPSERGPPFGGPKSQANKFSMQRRLSTFLKYVALFVP